MKRILLIIALLFSFNANSIAAIGVPSAQKAEMVTMMKMDQTDASMMHCMKHMGDLSAHDTGKPYCSDCPAHCASAALLPFPLHTLVLTPERFDIESSVFNIPLIYTEFLRPPQST